MSRKKHIKIANIRYYGYGDMLLLGKAIAARKQVGKKDIYQVQHWDGSTMGYKYKVPSSVHKNTPKQRAARLKMRAAMLSWNALHENEREEWKKKAEGKPLMGHNLFAQYWIKNNGFGLGGFGVMPFGNPIELYTVHGFGLDAFGISRFGSPS